MSRSVTVRVPRRGTLRAEYDPGGQYVDLYFGYAEEPYETINVWSMTPEGSTPDIRALVNAWVKEMDSDPQWSTWYEDILAATKA